jgi:LPXTG-site transpeptidase (sortase) family protein
MRIQTVLKLVVIAAVVEAAAGGGIYYFLSRQITQERIASSLLDTSFGWKFPITKFPLTGPNPTLLAYSSIRDPGGIPRGLPVRLQIPLIGVDSAIEDAVITPEGRMDVPAGTENVAWFALGPSPGQVGSAVIGGHFGINHGVKFVFYDLDKLRVGDKVYIVDDENNTLAFIVRAISSFDRNADATAVFSSHDNVAHLNLITCEGTWNQVDGAYPQRLVVFTDAIPAEGPAPASAAVNPATPALSASTAPAIAATFLRTLSVGSVGADVVALQSALEQRGLLELPPGVTNGFFGALTSAAVSKYQSSEGLPMVGIFGPQTRARLNSQLAGNPVLPSTGIPSVLPVATATVGAAPAANAAPSPINLPPASQSFIQAIKNAYATPLDGLITSILLLLIIFTVVKIIRL